MSATLQDLITETYNGGNPVVTTVQSPRSMGGTTLTGQSLENWPTNTAVHFQTYKATLSNGVLIKTSGSQTDWKGIASGSSIDDLTWRGGAADSGNSIGDYMEMMPTYSWAQDLAQGFELQHLTTGAHHQINNTGGLTTDTLDVTGLATLAGGTTGFIVGTPPIWQYLGYAQITSNATQTSSTPIQVTNLTSTVTVPTGYTKVRVTFFSASVGSSSVAVSEIWRGTVGSGTQIQQANAPNDSAASINVVALDTPGAGTVTYNVSLSTTGGTATIQATTTGPAFILVECC
jgi:hypothetical protein